MRIPRSLHRSLAEHSIRKGELKELEVGVDVIGSDRSYNIGIITRFDSKEDYLAYDVSEFHVEKVKKVIGPYMECSKTLDF